MADITRLKNHISDSGMTMVSIAKRSGIGRVTLYNRLNGKGEFTASEMMGLKKALSLTDAEWKKIFFP
mgnify:CR=1 FL=1